MCKWLRARTVWIGVIVIVMSLCSLQIKAAKDDLNDGVTMDRIQLVTLQIDLLKNRLVQSGNEFMNLQQHEKQFSQLTIEKVNKNLLDKAVLDIAVSKSNLDSISIELADSQQSINWLDKNVQEIENQLNVLGIFGMKIAHSEITDIQGLRADLKYQKKLLALEKDRVHYLIKLQIIANNILQLKKERYSHLNALLKSRRMLHIRQQQVKNELAYQEQQNYWLQQLNGLYNQLAKLDPISAKEEYNTTERHIFYANENANFAYVQSLIARYQDQIQQMKLTVLKNNSITLLNEISNQVQVLTKQINRLDSILKTRIEVIEKHKEYLLQKQSVEPLQTYIQSLIKLEEQYKLSDVALLKLSKSLAAFRLTLDQSLQSELSSRQGFPSFSAKTLLDLGREMLLIPALTFQLLKSFSTFLVKAFQSMGVFAWILLGLTELLIVFLFFFLRNWLSVSIADSAELSDQINFKWLGLQWLKRNFTDLVVICNLIGIILFFGMPIKNMSLFVYLALVWLACKGIISLARLCLIETTHDSAGHDVKLYYRLKWTILLGGVITALTVFIHELPMIYDLKILFDWLFLFFLLIISLLLLRSWEVVPNFILSHMESRHPYFQKTIRLMGILVPSLLLGNSIVGILGFINLIYIVSWYEGVFLFVLSGYLILRGFLSEGMEQLSRLLIQYVNNGWLWTEAFLKPIDKVLRITLFLVAWAVLFILYGWDKQSPIVERLTRLLHYQLANILNTTITPLNIIELFVVISVFYWTARWTREFVYRMLLSRTKDMGVRNSIAILSQYSVVVLGIFICLRVLGIDLRALAVVAGMFAFGVGLGLRDLGNNFASGFLILLERPLRVGDIVQISDQEGEVMHIGGRAVTIRTWDHVELVVPNAEVFNKSFTNLTAHDNVVRVVVPLKINRYDNPHEVRILIQNILSAHKDILKEPVSEVFIKQIDDSAIEFELRFFINIRQIKSRVSVVSSILMAIWDRFAERGIKPPYPKREIFLQASLPFQGNERSSESG